jgi:hypothetical protein
MGVSITATHAIHDFHMGYSGFFNLRKNIAMVLNKEFGENYFRLLKCIIPEQFEECDSIANSLIEEHNLDDDIVAFLYMSDCEGEVSYKVCGKLYNLIKDVDFGDKWFRYGAYAHNDYEEFKEFLKDCYSHRKKMRWH